MTMNKQPKIGGYLRAKAKIECYADTRISNFVIKYLCEKVMFAKLFSCSFGGVHIKSFGQTNRGRKSRDAVSFKQARNKSTFNWLLNDN